MSVLRKLFYENNLPLEGCSLRSVEYDEAIRMITVCEEKLLGGLNDKERDLIKEHSDASSLPLLCMTVASIQ